MGALTGLASVWPPNLAQAVAPNPADWALAYDVFLGTGDLAAAQQVAQRAVSALPRDRAWRRKLAQVSIWLSQPDVAAEQWLALFDLGDRSPEVVREVARLAPLRDEPLKAIEARVLLFNTHPPGPTDWMDIARLYEQAAEPLAGSRFFAQRFAQSRLPLLGELAAQLAERGGNDAAAAQGYEARLGVEPFSLPVLMAAAVARLRLGQDHLAYRLLLSYTERVAADSSAYWRLLGELAWQLQDAQTAQRAYTHYTQDAQATVADWSRLISLRSTTDPRAAAALADAAWQRYHQPALAMLALGLWQQAGDDAALGRFFGSLQPAPRQSLEADPQFLLVRAQWATRNKQSDAAWRDTQAALAIAPQNTEVVLSALWLAVDSGRRADLAQLLDRYAPTAQRQPSYWAVFAAGYQNLEQPRAALPWLRRSLRAQPGDALAWVQYADLLEATGQAGLAGRVRAHAWALLRQSAAAARPAADTPTPQAWALYRLALLERGSRRAWRVAQYLSAQVRGLPTAADDEQARVLVLGWLVQAEQSHNAQAWMRRQYLNLLGQEAPVWGQAQVALQLSDTPALTHLLRHHRDAMPLYNRYDALMALDRAGEAMSLAQSSLAHTDDAELQERLRLHLPAQAHAVEASVQNESASDIDWQTLRSQARLHLQPDLTLTLTQELRRVQAKTPSLAALPAPRPIARAELAWTHEGRSTRATWLEQGGPPGLRLTHSLTVGRRLSVEAELSWRMDSTDSAALRLDGRSTGWRLAGAYNLDRRNRLSLSAIGASLASRDGADMGRSQALEVDWTWAWRTEYPDWRARLYAAWRRSQAADGRLPDAAAVAGLSPAETTSLYLPASLSAWGACWGMGDNLAGQSIWTYSRAARPVVELCADTQTTGLSGQLGWVGSVSGEDHLQLIWRKTGASTTGAGASTWQASYRRFF